MKLFVYGISYPLIWLISLLPMPILYLISDLLFFILYYLIGYRKKVVMSNLSLAFPDKSEPEIIQLTKKFFQHFLDIMIESVKTFSISEKEILKRYTYKNPELVNELIREGKSIALMGAHLANWEWSISLPLVINTKVFGTYTKLANPYFDKKIKQNRTQFGVIGVKTSETVKNISTNVKNKVQGLYILLSDQSPMVHKSFYWRNFFNVKVPVHTGAEMIAKKFDFAVVNYTTKKLKRGYYETEFSLITDHPKDYENFAITDNYISITEKAIREQPAYYLWSHKRFKHKNKYEEWLQKKPKAMQKHKKTEI